MILLYPVLAGIPAIADGFQYNHMGSLAYIGSDKGVIDWGSSKPMNYGEIGAIRGWLMGFTVSSKSVPYFEYHSDLTCFCKALVSTTQSKLPATYLLWLVCNLLV